jgi:ketosteroid isomerase-like protein
MADNVTLIRSTYDAWNERDFDRLPELMAPDGRIVFVGSGEVFEGPDGSRRYSEGWANGFPDGRVTVDNIVADGDLVVTEFTGRGTHTGTLETAMGPIEPTGRSATLKFCDVTEVRDGKIVERRSYFDTGSMMAQLGLAEQATSSAQ